MLAEDAHNCHDAAVFVKTKRVRRANRTYEYLVLAQAVRINGKNTHRILFRLGEASALRESRTLGTVGIGQ